MLSNYKIKHSRDFSLDFFKGITAINIILAHTVWWSGSSYVPDLLRQVILFWGIPVSFFLSGASLNYVIKKDNPFLGVIRLIIVFALFYAFYALIFESRNILEFFVKSMFLDYPDLKRMQVVSGSVWFIPVFVSVYLFGYLLIKSIGNNYVILITCFVLLLVMFCYDFIDTLLPERIFFVTPDYLFSYSIFFLFGFFYYKKLRNTKVSIVVAISLILVSFFYLLFFFESIPFSLQTHKFPPRITYVIASFVSISFVILLSKYIKKEYVFNWIGKNALQYYLAQGVSSSLLYLFIYKINLPWYFKLLIAFICNVFLTSLFTFFIVKIQKKTTYILVNFFKSIDGNSIEILKSTEKK